MFIVSVCLDDKNNEIYIFWRFSVELKHKIISGGSHFDDGYNLLPTNLLEEDDQAKAMLIEAQEECAALSLSAPQSQAGKDLRSRILESCKTGPGVRQFR